MQRHLSCVAALALIAGGPVLGQSQPAPATEGTPAPTVENTAPPGRVLNGHVFLPSVSVAGALTTTSFGTFLETAYGSTTGSVQVGDTLYSGSFNYAGVGAILGFEYAFLDHFSARLTINELVYSGINGSSAIVVGTSVATAATLGFTASLPLGETLKVGLLLDGGIGPGLALTIGNGLRTLAANCRQGNCSVNEGSLFGLNNVFQIQPALALNWAPFRSFGVTANVSYAFVIQHRNNGDFNGQAFGLGVALDFDFKAISDVPIGLQAVYTWTAPTSGGGLQHVSDLGGGIFYTGRPHLALGLQIVARRFKVQPEVNVGWSAVLATIGLRYYF